MKLRFLLFFVFPFFFFSCVTTLPKNITYFQDLEKYIEQGASYNLKNYEPTIRAEDQLTIGVAAPVPNQEAVAQFNSPANRYLIPGGTMQNQQMTQVYTVDVDGTIDFPVIGKIQLAGLTKSEAIKLLKDKVGAHIPDPIIYLQIISFKVTVLGEVSIPGTINVPDEKISILDAIGAAGDLTIYGNRQNVLLIRDNNGKKEFAQFDLTKAEIFASPYYYLQQNDVIVVEPNNARKRESTYSISSSYQLSIINAIVTAISVLASASVAIYSISRK
jgi:polysaccharide export outer membrane protein